MTRTSKQLTASFIVTLGLAGCGQPAFAGHIILAGSTVDRFGAAADVMGEAPRA